MNIDSLRDKLNAARNTFEYRLERVLFGLSEEISSQINAQGLTRTEFARRLDASPAYVTKILNGYQNVTVKSLLKISDALGTELSVTLSPRVQLTQATQSVEMAIARSFVPVEPERIGRQIPEGSNALALAA